LIIQLVHESAPVYLFHKIYNIAPWYYVFVAVFFQVPSFMFILFTIGINYLRKNNKKILLFLILNFIYPLVIFILPNAPKQDGIRLFLPAIPFFAVISGIGLVHGINFINNIYFKSGIKLLLIIFFLGYIFQVSKLYPYLSSYYSEFIVGLYGANKIGFETDYWGSPNQNIIPWMNQHENDPFCVYPTTNHYYFYKAMGLLKPNVTFNASPKDCKYLVITMRQGMFNANNQLWCAVRYNKPIYTINALGVPIVAVYDYKNLECK
jgi:hypothetical protein